MSLASHLWTVWPVIRSRIRSPAPPAEEEFHTDVEDPDVGRIRLTGGLAAADSDSRLVILVHGLGGSIDSSYMIAAARMARRLGLASLRLNLRGADGGGADIYHAGLSSDLASVLASPALERFDGICLFGFSLGGHLCLRLATEVEDHRVWAVAALCSPLDLERTVHDFDRPATWIYRRYILSGLRATYAEAAGRGPLPSPSARWRRIRFLRDWDRSIVAPRFGFASAEDYYARANVAQRLDGLRVPALLVAAEGDPIVSAASVRAALGKAPERLRVEWSRRGGHVGLPPGLDLGQETPRGVAGQVLGWLLSRSPKPGRTC